MATTEPSTTTPSTSEPTTTTSASTSEVDTTGGSEQPGACGDGTIDRVEICDDGNMTPGDGCEPDCSATPGSPLWTVIYDGGVGHDGAYALAVDGKGNVVVGGGQAISATDNDPWVALYDSDGEEYWSNTISIGSGDDVVRGLGSAAGRVITAGSFSVNADSSDGFAQVFASDGTPGWNETFDVGVNDYFIGVGVDPDGFFTAGILDDGSGDTRPVVLHFLDNGGDYSQNVSTEDTLAFAGRLGGFLAVTATPDGGALVVGFDNEGGASDALAAVLDAEGNLVGETGVFDCGSGDSDFTDVAFNADGTAQVVGRCGLSGELTSLWTARLAIAGGITMQWDATYDAGPFTAANGFARDGDVSFIAGSTETGGEFDTIVLRWDGEAAEPTWVVPFAESSPGVDYAIDVALSPDDTIIAAGVVTQEGSDTSDGWVRKLAK